MNLSGIGCATVVTNGSVSGGDAVWAVAIPTDKSAASRIAKSFIPLPLD
jgi:hypothetical protein